MTIRRELAADPQPGVDLETAVQVRIIEQPFQPTTVRGFSKYTRISSSSSPACCSASRRIR